MPYEVEPEVAAVAREAADLLADLGHDVVEATPPWRDESLLWVFAHIWQLTPALYPLLDPDLLMPLNRALYDRAHATSSVEFSKNVSALLLHARRTVAFWNEVDVVLTPTLAKLPVPIGWIFEPEDPWEQFERGGFMTPFTPLVNVTGQPAGRRSAQGWASSSCAARRNSTASPAGGPISWIPTGSPSTTPNGTLAAG